MGELQVDGYADVCTLHDHDGANTYMAHQMLCQTSHFASCLVYNFLVILKLYIMIDLFMQLINNICEYNVACIGFKPAAL